MTESFSGSLADCPSGSSMALRHAVTCALPFSAKIRPEQAQLDFTQLAYNPYYWSNIDANLSRWERIKGAHRTLSYGWTYEDAQRAIAKNAERREEHEIRYRSQRPAPAYETVRAVRRASRRCCVQLRRSVALPKTHPLKRPGSVSLFVETPRWDVLRGASDLAMKRQLLSLMRRRTSILKPYREMRTLPVDDQTQNQQQPGDDEKEDGDDNSRKSQS